MCASNPRAAAEAARSAAGLARRAGNPWGLAMAITNLAGALLMLGDWDAAEREFSEAIGRGLLADYPSLACTLAELKALRGDAATAEAMLAGLRDDPQVREDPRAQAWISLVEAFAAAARHRPEDALRHARDAIAGSGAFGTNTEELRWGWPLAARAARDLDDAAAVRGLLSLLDDVPPGHLAPMLQAERDLVRARLAAGDGDPAGAAALAAAVRALRELSTPYHLAHGLLDYAQHLARSDPATAEAAISEARDIAERLHCQPLLDRAADLTPARPPVQA
jgi:hypothetical protein